ncbi:MAG TPA: glutamine amidotransferase [Actinomyces sp.]|nr:glutamine amidotransferase [Acidobacteriota bacterium]HHT40578.1 glutamine amidotransferase [Actinomyces sp.]
MGSNSKFLLLASRPQENIAESEYDMFLKLSGLSPERLVRHRMEQHVMPDINLNDWAGVILCGSPFDSLIPEQHKTDVQKRIESEISDLLDVLVAEDFPFLGVCYGVGTLLAHQGGVLSNKYQEEISAPTIYLTEEGQNDPITKGLPSQFQAYVGHKEACEVMPEHAVLLGTGEKCPVQLFKVKNNLYGTQFHPELDWPALHMRITEYADVGYYAPGEQQRIIDQNKAADVSHSHRIIPNFVEMFA